MRGLDGRTQRMIWETRRIVLFAVVTTAIYFTATRHSGISYWETAFWVIVFTLAISRLQLMWVDAKARNRAVQSLDALFAKF